MIICYCMFFLCDLWGLATFDSVVARARLRSRRCIWCKCSRWSLPSNLPLRTKSDCCATQSRSWIITAPADQVLAHSHVRTQPQSWSRSRACMVRQSPRAVKNPCKSSPQLCRSRMTSDYTQYSYFSTYFLLFDNPIFYLKTWTHPCRACILQVPQPCTCALFCSFVKIH